MILRREVLPKQLEIQRAEGQQSGKCQRSPVVVAAIPWSFHRRQLEQWLASKGKCYKRPPMTLPPKKPMKQKEKPPLRSAVQEEEKPEKPEQLHQARINALLSECLKLIEEVGVGKGLR